LSFLKFLEYFYKTYLIDYDMKIWNYYNNMEHITNHASESHNDYLNNLFPTKPSYYELIYKLNELWTFILLWLSKKKKKK